MVSVCERMPIKKSTVLGTGLPDLSNKNRYPVTFEFQINHEYLFIIKPSQILHDFLSIRVAQVLYG